MAYYHVYIPEYNLQGPSYETDAPERDRQKMVREFFNWLQGPQPQNTRYGNWSDIIHIQKDPGYLSGKQAKLRLSIRRKYNRIPVETHPTKKRALTTEELQRIDSGKLYGATWFQ